MRDPDGVVHFEFEAWWPWCMYPNEPPLHQRAERGIITKCELIDDENMAVTCVWCASRRKRPA